MTTDPDMDGLRTAQPRILVTVACRHCGHTDHVEPAGKGWEACTRCGEPWNAENRMWNDQIMRRGPRDPVHLYLWAVHRMLKDGLAYMQHRWFRGFPELEYPLEAHRAPGAAFIGWYGSDFRDDRSYVVCRYWYLIDSATHEAVVSFFSTTPGVFISSSWEIKTRLRQLGLLLPNSGRAFDFQIAKGLPRTLRIINPF